MDHQPPIRTIQGLVGGEGRPDLAPVVNALAEVVDALSDRIAALEAEVEHLKKSTQRSLTLLTWALAAVAGAGLASIDNPVTDVIGLVAVVVGALFLVVGAILGELDKRGLQTGDRVILRKEVFGERRGVVLRRDGKTLVVLVSSREITLHESEMVKA